MISISKERVRSFLHSVAVSSLISLLTTVVLIFLAYSSIFNVYELKSLDFFQKLNPPINHPQVTVVEINQRSLSALSEQGINWPWPRQLYVPLVQFCRRAGAEAILFDIIFSEPSSFGAEDDRLMAAAIAEADNVFMPVSLSKTDQYSADVHIISKFGMTGSGSEVTCKVAKTCIPPIDEFSGVLKGIGDVMVAPDRDGIYRRISLFTKLDESYFPSLAAAPLVHRFSLTRQGIRFDGRCIDTHDNGEVLLYYYGKGFDCPRINALDILSAYQNPDSSPASELSKAVAGQYIFIGLTAPGLYDLKPTPVTSVSPGVYVHATLLANLLNHDHVSQMDPIWKSALIFVLGTLLGLAIIKVFSFWKNILTAFLFVIGLPVASYVIFHLFKYWIGFLSYEVAALFVVGITSTYRYNTEGKKRRLIRRLFSQYMSEPLVKELEANPHKAKLGGEKRFITIFFSDLVNFTALSEKSQPEEIVHILNDYFTEMSQIILDSKGIIDKYQGDGIMAFWGAPITLEEHAEMACSAALGCQRKMKEINRRLLEEKAAPMGTRIGIHSGEAIVGNMGATQRFDYTVIGDSVNLASRLEGVNKEYGTDVIISEITYQLAQDRIEARELDLIAVKGKAESVRIFQLMGEKEGISDRDRKIKLAFEKGLQLYKSRVFDQAKAWFEKALDIDQDDKPALIYVERCSRFMKSPPPPDWDCVYRLTVK